MCELQNFSFVGYFFIFFIAIIMYIHLTAQSYSRGYIFNGLIVVCSSACKLVKSLQVGVKSCS